MQKFCIGCDSWFIWDNYLIESMTIFCPWCEKELEKDSSSQNANNDPQNK